MFPTILGTILVMGKDIYENKIKLPRNQVSPKAFDEQSKTLNKLKTYNKTEKIKLSAGEMIIYPSAQLHSVAEVKDGERHVCVGWIQSYVQNNEDRNFLFGLDAGAKG